jgi:predicted Zn-ribbon and HTH transcriptional regulator
MKGWPSPDESRDEFFRIMLEKFVNKIYRFEEPAECRECGWEGESESLIHSSLDAYGPLEDLFCPKCESDDIKLWRPRD